ncbi:type IV-A pilus assembly ATPase PilB [Candidatus Sumerlaeota bacterium]|nr:type IV-A pilus assembly ATPase PilB [Candidatus Sumerlaeota bacterium]
MPSVMERKLGEILVKDKIITQEELEEALKKQDETGESLGQILVKKGVASEWEIAAALGKQLNVPFITLSHYEIDPEVFKSIPEEIIKKYKIVPVDKTGNTLTVALADPSNIYLLDELRILTKCQIVPVISYETDILETIRNYTTEDKSKYEEMLKDITDEEEEMEVVAAQEDANIENDIEAEVNEAPVIQLVNLIISEAIKTGASDIHIEPQEKSLRLRYRIDGVLQERTPPPKKFQNAIISRIKIMAEMDIAERRLPQDGRFKVRTQGRNIDFRVSTVPSPFGEKVVLRILDRSKLVLDLKQLGFDAEILDVYNKIIRRPWGMILVTGPTGSGKSTTLYATLNTINDPRKNILTIEDPIEYQLKGITQVQARPEIGLTFANGLRAFLRQDPDIILVGEIRDHETADIAIKSALTGHLVLSTLHTNDAPSTPTRLINMGVEPFLVSATLLVAIAQRLVRRICEHCKEPYVPSIDMLRSLGINEDISKLKFYRGKGCPNCHHTGYRGRIALYEMMVITDRIRDLILKRVPANVIKEAAIEEGMQTLRQAGIKKVLEGITTIEEVLSVTVADTEIL